MGLLDSIPRCSERGNGCFWRSESAHRSSRGLLAQSGGLQGLANKFSQSGCGGVFASWVGMGENQSISSDQIQKALGSQQVQALAKMGIDPAQASNLLGQFLPKVVDKLDQPASRSDGGSPAGLGRADPIAPAKCRWFVHVALFPPGTIGLIPVELNLVVHRRAAIIAHITRSKTGRVISGRLLSEKCGRGFSGIIREHRRDKGLFFCG